MNLPIPPDISYEGGDGLTIENAVVIKDATGATGVPSEYAWLAHHYPGFRLSRQALKSADGKHYDVMSFTTASGKPVDIYFDISGFFGK